MVSGGDVASARVAWAELWQARGVVRAFLVRSLRVRYRQAVLGVGWAVIQPLALLVPFVAFLGEGSEATAGAGAASGRASYAAATLAALVAWQYLSGAVSGGASALVAEAFLVRKTWFPREAPVVAAVGASAIELVIGLAVFAVAGPLLGARAGWGIVALPLVVVCLLAVALAVAIPLAAANAVYRDVRHALPFALLLWLFLSPVAYPLDRVRASRQVAFALVNPAAGPIDAARRVLAEGRLPHWPTLGASLATAAVVGWAGHRAFRRLAPILPDVV